MGAGGEACDALVPLELLSASEAHGRGTEGRATEAATPAKGFKKDGRLCFAEAEAEAAAAAAAAAARAYWCFLKKKINTSKEERAVRADIVAQLVDAAKGLARGAGWEGGSGPLVRRDIAGS